MKLTRQIAVAVQTLSALALITVCLAYDWLRQARLSWPDMYAALDELSVTIHSPSLQWLVVVCLSSYCLCFDWLHLRDAPSARVRCSLGLAVLVLSAIGYLRSYTRAFATTDTLMLVYGMTLFTGIAFWQALKVKQSRPLRLPATVLGSVLLVLCLAVSMSQQNGQISYRGRTRWTGWWDNPNMSGMLMAAGMVLTVGWLISISQSANLKGRVWRLLQIAFLSGAAVICGIGLLKSYCRGAWLGAFAGLCYLTWQTVQRLKSKSKNQKFAIQPSTFSFQLSTGFGRNWLPASAIFLSVLVLAVWNYRHTDHVPARRIASFTNSKDFSSRNRLAAWQGALQMAADKPWFGFGWNMQDQVYAALYCAPKLEGWRAIRTNDFLKLANTVGIPALACFVAFIGLSLTPGAKRDNLVICHSSHVPSIAPACRAGAVVLLVGLWFEGVDGGLFRLATGSLFWILLALGSVEEVNRGELMAPGGHGEHV